MKESARQLKESIANLSDEKNVSVNVGQLRDALGCGCKDKKKTTETEAGATDE